MAGESGVEKIVNDIIVVPIIYDSEFTQKLIEFLGIKVAAEEYFEPKVFSGGEFCPKFLDKIEGKHVYIVAPPSTRIDPEAWKTRVELVSDAAKRFKSSKNVLIASDLPYSRQDRCPENDPKFAGQPFSAEVLAKGLHINGIDQIITMDVHSERIPKIYSRIYGKDGQPAENVFFNLDPAPIAAHYLLFNSSLDVENNGSNIVFVAPDEGALEFVKRVRRYMFLPNSSYVACKKTRGRPNDPDAVKIDIGYRCDNYNGLEGKTLIFLDDIGDTCGTIITAYNDLMAGNGDGKPKEMFIYLTHPVMAGQNFFEPQKKLQQLNAKEIIISNSHPFIEDRRTYAFKKNSSVLRCAAYFASAAVNCTEMGRKPEEVFYVNELSDLDKFAGLYEIKRSTLHFLNKDKVIRPVKNIEILGQL